MPHTPQPIKTDALVIGAGPVGLFQVFQLGLQGMTAHVVDSLAQVGGQPIELYPNKPIYDIPAIPVCTGAELTHGLMQQIKPFDTPFHLGQEVCELVPLADGGFDIKTSTGTHFMARTVFIAAGVGAFRPRTLGLEGISTFENQQLFYQFNPEQPCADQHIVVMGADDDAIQAVLDLSDEHHPNPPASVTLLHRRAVLTAQQHLQNQLHQRLAQQRIRWLIGQPTAFTSVNGILTSLRIYAPDALLGLSPKLGPIANWGLALDRKQLPVDPASFATSTQGIYAVGDINTYPGKRKLIVCGFHEATLAAFAAHAELHPNRSQLLHYTTTSPLLHQRLGITSPNKRQHVD
jgi:thioredoxin reductase (NADPH)